VDEESHPKAFDHGRLPKKGLPDSPLRRLVGWIPHILSEIVLFVVHLFLAVFAFEHFHELASHRRRLWACLIVSAVLGLLIGPFVAQWTSAPSWRWGLFAVIVLAGFTLGVILERRHP